MMTLLSRVRPQRLAIILAITGLGVGALITNHIEVVTIAVGGLIAFGKDLIREDIND